MLAYARRQARKGWQNIPQTPNSERSPQVVVGYETTVPPGFLWIHIDRLEPGRHWLIASVGPWPFSLHCAIRTQSFEGENAWQNGHCRAWSYLSSLCYVTSALKQWTIYSANLLAE